MKLRTRVLAGVAGSALIVGTMLFGNSPAGATTPGVYDWNTKCESVALSLSVGTVAGVIGGGSGGSGGASSTYTAQGYCGTYTETVEGTYLGTTDTATLPNGQVVNRRAQWAQFGTDLGVIRARIEGNFNNHDQGVRVADAVTTAFVDQNNALFGGLPTHVGGTRQYVDWVTGLTGVWKLPTTVNLENGTTALPLEFRIRPSDAALWSTDANIGLWAGNGYATVLNDAAIFAAGCGASRAGGVDGGGSETGFGTYWKASVAAGCNITVANGQGGLTVLGGVGMSYRAYVVGAPPA